MDPVINLEPRKEGLSGRVLAMNRKMKVIPASIYGKEVDSTPVWFDLTKSPVDTLRTGQLFQTTWNGKKFRLKMNDIQRSPLSRQLMHVSFHAVSPGEIIEVDVPIKFTGVAEGTKTGGVVIPITEFVTLKGRPKDLPKEIIIDVTKLDMNNQLTMNAIEVPTKIELMAQDMDQVLVTCKPPQAEKSETNETDSPGEIVIS